MNLQPNAGKVKLAGAALLAGLLLACGGSDSACGEGDSAACVWAGTGAPGFNGDGLTLAESRLYWPIDIGFAPDGTAWVLDWNNHLVRQVLPEGRFQTAIGDFLGDGPPDKSDLTAPGAAGITVRLNHPTDIAFGPDGLIYLAAWHNHKIRTLDSATGLVRVLGGRGAGFAGDGGPVEKALFNQPNAIGFAPDGSLYVLDQRNQRIRKIEAGPERIVTTVAGTGAQGFAGDGGPPLQAQLNFETGPNPNPSGSLAVGPDGSLYVADALNFRIRRIDFASNVIETVAGTGVQGFAGDGGPALQAKLGPVNDLEFGPDGRLYLADTENNCVRAIDLETGIIEMVWDGSGEGGELKGAARLLNRPFGIAFDPAGRLYIADTYNSRIILVSLPSAG
jgi:sugar lactone lactonase YvrE